MRQLAYQPVCKMSNHSNGKAVKASIYNLLQHRSKITTMSDFTILFNLYGQYDNFDDWDAAEEREIEEKREKRHKELTARELNQIEDEQDEINTKKKQRNGQLIY